VSAPSGAEPNRYRVEVWEGTTPVTFTSHVWIDASYGGLDPQGGGGCEISSALVARTSAWRGWVWGALAMLAGAVVRARRRRGFAAAEAVARRSFRR
jgi:hypothetical protein